MSEKDIDRRLRDLFHEAHRPDEPSPFRRVWSAALLRASGPRPGQRSRQTRWGWRPWIWASAATAVALLSIASGSGIHRMRQQRELAQQLWWTEARDPLGFLLDTPGRDLLRTVPTFDVKGEWP